MFDYFIGKLKDKTTASCTVEVNNIGYRFLINSRTYSKLCNIGDDIKIYSKLIHKEDSMTLCGFLHKSDRIIFDILTAVSGIGTKAAFALLNEFEVDELIDAVVGQDYKKISRTKGIGEKMAQKIVLELKDKLTKLDTTAEIIETKSINTKISKDTITQTITILQSLGYDKNEYNSALESALLNVSKDDAQEVLKEVLKILSAF